MDRHPFVPGFDSAAFMLRAVSRFLRGKDIPNLDAFPASITGLGNRVSALLNRLPVPLKEAIYTSSGIRESVPAKRLKRFSIEGLSQWAADQYPRRRFPCVFIGSPNGAAAHLCAALDAPFLPQTFLIAVRRLFLDPDAPEKDMKRSLEPARMLLANNPDYDTLYCARGEMENRIKEQQLGLFADRTSCMNWLPNQFRLLLSSLAYCLLETIRNVGCEGTELARAQSDTLRLRLLKIGAIIIRNTRRVRILLASGYPWKSLFWTVARKLCPS